MGDDAPQQVTYRR